MNQIKEEHTDYITVTQGMSGFYAVHVWWNPDGFWEPYQTGIGRYRDKDKAILEAKSWAITDGIRLDSSLRSA